jgi:aspartate/methionine/tyrosine aminotransferase
MSNISFARRVEKLRYSSSMASMRQIRELRQSGVKVHDFGSKFDTPEHVKAAAIRYLESSAASLYADSRGLPEFRAAIARKLLRENKLQVDPETEITVSPGGKQGILTTLLALVDAGDEVLVEDPGWFAFEPMVRISGAKPVPLPLRDADGFRFSMEDLRKRITRRTRMLILCNPHNPTGRVLDRTDLEAIAAVVQEHDLLVLMDEAYEHFLYDGVTHTSIATLEGMRARTITVQTASKTYNMFGWRVGWVVAPAQISEKIQLITSHSFSCVTSFAQAGAAAALDGTIAQGQFTIAELVKNYQVQRNAFVGGLKEIRGVSCVMPRGAYFAFPKFRRFKLSSQELCDRLMTEARVSGQPGSAFGKCGEGHIRFVFNAPVTEIVEGVQRLQQFLKSL